jgi:hypothetical protein
MTTVIGSKAVPASSGLKFATVCSPMTSRNSAPPLAAYSSSVTRFAAVNCRERNKDKGNIGFVSRRSTATNAPSARTPTISGTSTAADAKT